MEGEGIIGEGVLGELTHRRGDLTRAVRALEGLEATLYQAGGGDLGPLLGELDQLVTLAEAGRVGVLREAMDRGETGSVRGGPVATSVTAWLQHWAPSLRAGGAGPVVAVATAFGKSANAPVRAAVASGRLPVRAAATVVTEYDRLQPLLGERAQEPVLQTLIETAAEHGPTGCRRVRPFVLATFGRDGLLQERQDAARRFTSLSPPLPAEGTSPGLDLYEYRLTLDVESKEILEAALGPLSAPRPSAEEPDLRPYQQRRAEALVEVVQRGVAAGGAVPTTAKAQLFVTVEYETLAAGVRGAGATLGGLTAGTLLAPETVRRLACDASIIPVVLGTDGEVLDWGRAKRLFTAAQTRRLWLRDGGCSYPGCDVPPQWTDGHHLRHWSDGGETACANAALLCRRHHTLVHVRRLAGAVVAAGGGERVRWDLTPGSYDALLAAGPERERDDRVQRHRA